MTYPRLWSQSAQDQIRQPLHLVQRTASFSLHAVPGLLLSFADLLGIPSGLHAAYVCARSGLGLSVAAPLTGCVLSLLLRLVWGLPVSWDQAAVLVVAAIASPILRRRRTRAIFGWTALSLLPCVLWQGVTGSMADLLYALSSAAIAALAAPIFLRAMQVYGEGRAITGMEERIAVGFFAAMLTAGGARIMLFRIDLGVLMASGAICCMALYLGVSAGTITGLVAGLTLALQGLPVQSGMCLACGGFLAGVLQPMNLRPLTCLAFAAGAGLTMLLSGSSMADTLPAILTAALVITLLPPSVSDSLQCFFRRFINTRTPAGDAFAAAALGRWEHTMEAMAHAIPAPRPVDGPREGDWWRQHLCATCPDYRTCVVMMAESAIDRAESVWKHRDRSDADWPAAMDELRGLGCGRLYCLREGMTAMRAEEASQRVAYHRACHQRDMLVTHLTAMAGSAQRFSHLSGGQTWWDEMSMRAIRRAIDEQSFPADLLYLRRVDGHVCAALQMQQGCSAQRSQEDLLRLVSGALDLPMQVDRLDHDRLYLTQAPPWRVTSGIAAQGAAGSEISGDHTWLGTISGGLFLAAVSDGMGQGDRAGSESASAVELLRLCMEAGYTRAQTLTAVNGMLLLETGGERFATVDLLTLDLWTGQAALDKLGAVSSWLLRGETLLELTGDALPIGILETVASQTSLLHLKPHDRLLLLTDGVEDAFSTPAELELAIRLALTAPTPQEAADALLARALSLCPKHDDMTVVVIQPDAIRAQDV